MTEDVNQARCNVLPIALGGVPASGTLRDSNDDFRVVEELGFEPDGSGDHIWLLITKDDRNTTGIARRLSEISGARLRDIGYSGLKDRHAITTQWFSVPPGKGRPDVVGWENMEPDGFVIERASRHARKLRRGTHRRNRFRIRVTDLAGDSVRLDERLGLVSERGFPNYFGEQRFGVKGSNLTDARKMFSGEIRVHDRHRRGLCLSAARAEIFNRVLAQRIREQDWDAYVPGDAMMLDGSRSWFVPDAWDTELERRLGDFDIHPSGPLWGQGTAVLQRAGAVEQQVVDECRILADGLIATGVKMSRRPLRARPYDFGWEVRGDVLELSFALERGQYATALLRECLQYRLPRG